VNSGKFVRVVILPLRGKDRLSGRRKAVERDPACCGRFPYKLLNGDVAVPLWAVNFGKQILVSPLWLALFALISSIFTFLPLDLLGCACL
jgi:hypothetical protein